jgi:DNA-binding SARP family transcriptional activator/tetratricopeptide (TPR) repeat protein
VGEGAGTRGEFRVLGPVEVRAAGGERLDSGPPRQRAVLAALAVDAGRVVPVDELVDRVWSDEPPAGARRALHSYIARVRRLVGQVPARIVREGGGYLLDTPRDSVDALRFSALVEAGRDPRRPDADRAELLGRALAMWDGQPLGGVSGAWADRTRHAWQERYLGAVTCWAPLALAGGDGAEVVDRLTGLVAQHPLVEPLTVWLMRALAAQGRTAQALERYAAARARLGNELGTDPGAELEDTYRTLLAGSPDRPSGRPAAPGTGPATPRMLPADGYRFAGRARELDRLDALLEESAAQPTAVVISALSGTPGVGKTALAVHWAHRVKSHFPDGQLYVNLRGFDPYGEVVEPAAAVRLFVAALGVPPASMPSDPAVLTALYRERLAGRRVLVLLDNARDPRQVRELLPAAPGCLVVVTSRSQLAGLVATEAAHPIVLDVLSEADARHLLARRLGTDRVAAEPDAVAEIVARCARLPLALAIAAARAAARPGLPLAALASELRDPANAFADAEDPYTDLRSLFSWSYRALSEGARQLFRALGEHPGPDISVEVAAALAGIPIARAGQLIRELHAASLLAETSPDRYVLHDLLSEYAASLPGADPLAPRRLLDFLLRTTLTATLDWYPTPSPFDPPPAAPGTPTLTPADPYGWLTAERQVIMAAFRRAIDGGYDEHVWKLSWCMLTYLHRAGFWSDWVAMAEAAVPAAERDADLAGVALTYRNLGRAYEQVDRYEEAWDWLHRALEAYERVDDPVGQTHTHRGLALILDRQGRYPQALRHSEQALDAARRAGHEVAEAHALNYVGWLRSQLDDHGPAVEACQQSVALFQKLGDPSGAAAAWDSLGYAQHRGGDVAATSHSYRQSADLHRETGSAYFEADALHHLGDNEYARGDHESAVAAWQRAAALLAELRHRDAEVVRSKLDDHNKGPTGT